MNWPAATPWLTKRVRGVLGERLPGRHPLAYALAAVVPYSGRLGAGFGVLILVYIVAMLAAVAIPQYQAYVVKARLSQAVQATAGTRDALAQHFLKTGQIPASLADAGQPEQAAEGSRLQLDPAAWC